MIKVVHGDVLKVERGIILHGCNAQGVMGSGIAKQIKEQFPKAYETYRKVYEEHGLQLGSIVWKSVGKSGETYNKWIGNCITQNLYGKSGDRFVSYDAIADCMEKVVDFLEINCFEQGFPVVFPQIGAGLGGGNWNVIEKIIDETIPDFYEKILYMYKG